ncbi:hypothetical protein BDN67DRAFT_911508, partial [Paxillus ammoniavirescens]
QQDNELVNVSLLHSGLLGCSLISPMMAISVCCLEFYHQLCHHQSSFGIQAFAKVLCVLNNVTYKSSFCDQFSFAFNAYLAILQEI